MRKSLKVISFAIAMGGIIGVPVSHAITLTFDDFTVASGEITDGYGGFNWDKFWYMDPDKAQKSSPHSGFHYGTITSKNVSYNFSGADGTMIAIEKDLPKFTFNSAVFTAGWRNNLQLQIIGYLDGIVAYDNTYLLQYNEPRLIVADYWDINKLIFKSSGGTRAPEIEGTLNVPQFVMDNFRFNDPLDQPTGSSSTPEPATLLMLGSGLTAIGVIGRKKRR